MVGISLKARILGQYLVFFLVPCRERKVLQFRVFRITVCSERILTFGIRSIRSPAKVGLVIIKLLTTIPVVSWRGVGDPPHP